MNVRRYSYLILLLMLSGCPTPPGQLRQTDYIWREETVMAPPKIVYQRLSFGFENCGPETGGPFIVTHVGTPRCVEQSDAGSVLCDVYVGSETNGFVLGQILVTALDEHSSWVRVGVVTRYDEPVIGRPGQTRRIWMRFAHGADACPDN